MNKSRASRASEDCDSKIAGSWVRVHEPRTRPALTDVSQPQTAQSVDPGQ